MNNNINKMNFINNMNSLNNMNNLNNMNIMNNINLSNYNHFDVKFIFKEQEIIIKSFPNKTINDLIKKFFLKIGGERLKSLIFIFNSGQLYFNNFSTLALIGIWKDSKISVLDINDLIGTGHTYNIYNKEINIKFLKLPNNYIYKDINQDIIGILKLCLLKEISQKLTDENLKQLPDILNYIMKLLQRGYIRYVPIYKTKY